MNAAVFSDVEGTLVSGSMPGLFLAMGRKHKSFKYPRRLLIDFLDLVLPRLLPGKFKRQLQLISLLLAIKGQTPAQVQTLIEQVTPLLKENFKSKTLERIKEHQQAGLPLILVSAAMHQAVAYLGKEMQGRGEGTHIRQNDGRYIFKVEGGVCQGEGKAARAKAVIAELNLDASKCYAYGDTASDIPFLELFGFPCAVDPDLALEQEARQRGWPVLRNN